MATKKTRTRKVRMVGDPALEEQVAALKAGAKSNEKIIAELRDELGHWKKTQAEWDFITTACDEAEDRVDELESLLGAYAAITGAIIHRLTKRVGSVPCV